MRFTWEGCFVPVTPKSIKYHTCDPKIIAAREKEREEANKELNEIQDMMTSDDYEYAFKGMTNEEILIVMRDDIL